MIDKLAHIIFLGWHLFLRDFKIRYRRTVFGFFWALAPVISLGLGVIILSSHLGMRGNSDTSYLSHVLAGLLIFQIFLDAFSTPQRLVRRFRTLLDRIPFPQESLIVASAFYVLLNFLLRLPLLVIILIYFSLPIQTTVFLSLAALPILFLWGLSLGLIIAPPSIIFLDIRYALPFVQSIFFFATPLIYLPPKEGWLFGINSINPLTYLVLSIRDWMIGGDASYGSAVLWLSLIVIALFAISVRYFKKAMQIGLTQI